MKKISWWRTNFGEEEVRRIATAIADEHVSQGPITAEFEQRIGDILGVPYVVATTSGSVALLMALLALGIGPGDEVIVPNRTWIATAHAPLFLGAKVVFVDVEPDRPIIDVRQVEEKVSPRTKAIIPAHLNGRSAAMDEINRIAAAYGLHVIEDAAQAFCSRNKQGVLGTQSDIGCYSLSVAKIISTGQGGFMVTRSADLYERLRLMRTHGVRDVINAAYSQLGFNFRFTDIQAAMGMAQLDRLPGRIARVRAIQEMYAVALKNCRRVTLIPVDLDRGEIPIYVEILCSERDRLIAFLASHGIEVRPFYPDLHETDYFGTQGQFPRSHVFAAQGIFLPCGPGQPDENVERVVETLRRFEMTA